MFGILNPLEKSFSKSFSKKWS